MIISTRRLPAFVLAVLLVTLAPPSFATASDIADARGCRFVDPNPQPDESVTWTGACIEGWGTGEGMLTWFIAGKPHACYRGTLANGRPQGTGIETLHVGDRYEGSVVEGFRQGHGVFLWSNGMRYEGGFERNRISGDGSLRLPDFTRFEGHFENGLLLQPVALVKPQIGAEVRVPLEMADSGVDPHGRRSPSMTSIHASDAGRRTWAFIPSTWPSDSCSS